VRLVCVDADAQRLELLFAFTADITVHRYLSALSEKLRASVVHGRCDRAVLIGRAARIIGCTIVGKGFCKE
jgi:hypothetical protein